MPGKRKTIRLKNYDYAQEGAYCVTVCVNDYRCIFGDVVDEEMVLNEIGEMVDQFWNKIPEHFPHVTLDEYIVMPNHLHGIIIIVDSAVGANNYSPLKLKRAKDFSPLQISFLPSRQRPNGTSKTIGSIVRGFKIGVTKWVRQNTNMENVWQRNYYEHIIRSEPELTRVREYIKNNPIRWRKM